MSLQIRYDKVLARLKARTGRDGKAVKGYEQNVAVLRAELNMLQERMNKTENQESE